jgi:hypothetical protein
MRMEALPSRCTKVLSDISSSGPAQSTNIKSNIGRSGDLEVQYQHFLEQWFQRSLKCSRTCKTYRFAKQEIVQISSSTIASQLREMLETLEGLSRGFKGNWWNLERMDCLHS